MGTNYKAPPAWPSDMTYESWKTEIDIWMAVTELKAEKQAPAVALTLTDRKREIAKETPLAELKSVDGMKILLEKFKKAFQREEIDIAFDDYVKFEQHKRDYNTSVAEHLINFDTILYAKLLQHKMVVPDAILACKLLYSTGLDERDRKMVLAATPKLEFESMKSSLRRIFGDAKSNEIEIISGFLPLLLSVKSMHKMGIMIDLNTYTFDFPGVQNHIQLQKLTSGHIGVHLELNSHFSVSYFS